MKYAILIYSDEKKWASMPPAQAAQVLESYMAYSSALRAAGKLVNGEELNTISSAKTLRVHDGKTSIADGPYADTKEQLGGLYLIEVETEAEALAWAARCPGALHGAIELRPVIPH